MEIYWCEKLGIRRKEEFQRFLDAMSKRIAQGHPTYGDPVNSGQPFLHFLKCELDAYDRTGNRDHLINIANYAWLESIAPQHPNSHMDARTASTRRKRRLM